MRVGIRSANKTKAHIRRANRLMTKPTTMAIGTAISKMVQIVSGILAVACVVIIIVRRKSKKKGAAQDDF